jgi:hypothetical protein
MVRGSDHSALVAGSMLQWRRDKRSAEQRKGRIFMLARGFAPEELWTWMK